MNKKEYDMEEVRRIVAARGCMHTFVEQMRSYFEYLSVLRNDQDLSEANCRGLSKYFRRKYFNKKHAFEVLEYVRSECDAFEKKLVNGGKNEQKNQINQKGCAKEDGKNH